MKRKLSTQVCKVDGCEKFSIARGMCPTHWKRWRKANPTIAVPQDSREQTLKMLPATTSEVCERLEISHGHAKRVLRQLHLAKLCHIGDWRAPLNKQGSQWAPIYHKGAAEDAKLDIDKVKRVSKERSLVRNRRNHAIRTAYKRRGRPASFAALLAPLGLS